MLAEEQKPIDLEIVRALIRATPNSWRMVQLDVEREVRADGSQAHQIAIQSPEGHGDVVMPSSELMLSLRKLDLLFERYGHPWSKVHYSVSQTDGDDWSFQAKYEYP